MKLDYRILWLDDRMEAIIEDGYKDEIIEYLDDLGFHPVVITVESEEGFFSSLNDSYDLIMTDYNLNDIGESTRNGADIVKAVRAQSIFTEIMFYSAQGTVIDTFKIDRITFVDTSQSAATPHNDQIVERVKRLIDLTVRKFQHIVSMRGMIMHEAAHLDEVLFDLCQNNISTEEDQDIIDDLFAEIVGFYRRKFELSSKYQRNNRVEKVFQDPLLFSFTQRANVLSSILDKRGLNNFIPDFKTQIIQIRNQFAHAVLDEETNVFKTRNGIEFNDSICKDLRRNIKKHKNNLDDIADQL